MSTERQKIYVDVIAAFKAEGPVLPKKLRFPDGSIYAIERVVDIQRAAARKTGGIGLRYHCVILGQDTYIWLEDDALKWFVEAKTEKDGGRTLC